MIHFRRDANIQVGAATSGRVETRGIAADVINVTLGSRVAQADTPVANGRRPGDVFV